MRRTVRAGVLYFLVVFAAGFVLGTARALLVAPRLGELAAVALELPPILAVAWVASRALARRFAIPPGAPRLAVGGLALALLLLAEAALAILGFGRSPAEYVAAYLAPPALLGLAGQIAFALLPLLLGALDRGAAGRRGTSAG
jgi:hypothetical protein